MHVGLLYWSLLTYVSFSQLLCNNLVRCNVVGSSPTCQLASKRMRLYYQTLSFSQFSMHILILYNLHICILASHVIFPLYGKLIVQFSSKTFHNYYVNITKGSSYFVLGPCNNYCSVHTYTYFFHFPDTSQ